MTLILPMKNDENFDKFNALFPRIFHAEDKGNSWLIKSPLKLIPEISIIDDLIKIPSVIMQHLYLKNGKLFIDIRFHESRRDFDKVINDRNLRKQFQRRLDEP